MLIAGDREVEEGQISIRLRSGENLDALSVADAVAMMTEKVAQKAEV
jgi:threonyl-tRNA synthetase